MSAPAGSDDPGSVRPSEVESGFESDLEIEPAAAADVFGERVGLARTYVQRLATDGVVRGLIGPREPERLWTRHVLNCAAVAELMPAGARVVDVGSGAGLPGLVLAIVRPDCTFALLEPLDRRVRFLVEVVDGLGLDHVTVVRARAQDAPAEARSADVVVSRAVAPLSRLAGWSAGLATPGGTILALKGSSAGEELDRDRDAIEAAGLLDAEVVTVDGPAGPTVVVRARRAPFIPRGRGGSAGSRRGSSRRGGSGRPSGRSRGDG